MWDVLRAGLVVTFAFFVASFPARNADVWLHLATGRALIQGDYQLGTDPFSYTTAESVWVNHAWLFDAASYGLHVALGGAGLVVAKAFLIALLAVWLLWPCWPGPHRWLALLLVAAAVTAIGPFALLRPMCVSLLFLGITYVWLERTNAVTWRQTTPLLVLFAVWANVDEWILLGPAMSALWWLGTLVAPTRQSASSASVVGLPLIVIALAGLAVALLNPHHVRVFTMPALLDPAAAEYPLQDAGDRAALYSPWEYLDDAASLQQPARLAYGGLIVIGLLSFAVQGAKLSIARLLVWAAFLTLSVYRAGAIPFFAVVAGPISALNFQEWLARRPASTPLIQSRLVIGLLQFVSLLLFAGAAAAGWAGWVHGWPGEPRRWELALDPSLEAAAKQVAQWRADGKLAPEARALPTSAAAAYALAWWSPAEKSFCDDRPHLFPAEIRADFAAMRRALFGSGGGPQELNEWRALLDKHGITHLVVDHPDDNELVIGLTRLFPSTLWTLHYLRGRTTVFARRDGQILAVPGVDAWARAYEPTPADKAPARWPGRDPEPRNWLDAFYRPPPSREPGRDECLVWQAHFAAQQAGHGKRVRALWEPSLAASLVGLPLTERSAPAAPAGMLLRGACLRYAQGADRTDRSSPLYGIAFHFFQRFVALQDEGPPGSLFLAVRAARRALGKSPDDARAYLNLGDAYMRLRRQTRERALGPAFEPLEHVRRIQALTALRQAVALNPELLPAHDILAELYREIGYLDLALQHVEALSKLVRIQGPMPDESQADFQARLDRLDELEKQAARPVRDAQLALRSLEMDAFAKAQLAMKNGLSGQALDLLRKADAASLGQGGIVLKLDLLLHTGDTGEARELLQPELEAPIGHNSYCWLHTYLAAANGDYDKADGELERIDSGIDLPDMMVRRAAPNRAVAFAVGRYLLDLAAGMKLPIGIQLPLRDSAETLINRTLDYRFRMRLQADIAALRGMLALEAGDIGKAREQMRRSLQIFDDPQGAGGLARHYLQLMQITHPAPRAPSRPAPTQ